MRNEPFSRSADFLGRNVQEQITLTGYVPQFAQTVVLETSDAIALFALVTGLQETEYERADDHVAGDQGEQSQIAEQVREELAHAPA